MKLPRRVAGVRAGSTVLLTIILGARAPAAPGSGPPQREAIVVEALPRFVPLWTREGLGRHAGAGSGDRYITVANDGDALVAVDVTSGKTLWQTKLPERVTDWLDTNIVGDSVLLAYQRKRDTADVGVAGFSLLDGRHTWSRAIVCEGVRARAAGAHYYLQCGHNPRSDASEVRAMDPLTGKELGRAPIESSFELGPGGEVCGVTDRTTWCGRLAAGRVSRTWSKPEDGAGMARLWVASGYVVRAGDRWISVRRLKDGERVWQRAVDSFIDFHGPTGGIFVPGKDSMEVLRLGDGITVGRLPITSRARVKLLEGDQALFEVDGTTRVMALLPHSGTQVRLIDHNVAFPSQVVGDVLLSQDVGQSGSNRESAALRAYSLTRLGPPQKSLDPYHQAVAVLERHPFTWEAETALAALERVPDAMSSLEAAINREGGAVRESAIAVAGETGDPRFVRPLRRVLEGVSGATTMTEWSLLITTVSAIGDLTSPDVAPALLAFWQRVGSKLTPPFRRELVRDATSSAIWKVAARQPLVRCEDFAFPVSPAPPEQAVIGTKSPGVEYAAGADRRWAAVCQAREDSDGNGRLEVVTLHHGDTGGDHLRPYLVLGSGPGTEIDDFVAADPTGRWLVVTKQMCVYLVNAQSGQAAALKGADGRPGDPSVGPHRAASFSPDGKRMLYIRSDGTRATVIQRDLTSSAERSIAPGPGELSQAFFDSSGRFVTMEVTSTDTDGDGRLRPQRLATVLGARRCRGPVMSFSSFGQVGDRPVQRVAPIDGGPVTDAPAGKRLAPKEPPKPSYELAPAEPRPEGPDQPLSSGPFRWTKAR